MKFFSGSTEFREYSVEELISKLEEKTSAPVRARILITLGSRMNTNPEIANLLFSEIDKVENHKNNVMGIHTISMVIALIIIQYGDSESKQQLKQNIENWGNDEKAKFKDFLDFQKINILE